MKSVIMHMLRINMMLGLTGSPNGTEPDSELAAVTPSNTTACYYVYGEYMCFPLDTPWSKDWSPLAHAPFTTAQMNTKIYFYQRYNFSRPHVFEPGDAPAIQQLPINPHKPIRLVTHGYLSSCRATWAKGMIAELVKTGDNIFCLNWSDGASPPYSQASANVRMVGVQLGHFIHSLHRYANISLSSVHVTGHSLGAHVAGKAGTFLKESHNLTLARITGLDPAGPYFAGTPPAVRLDSSDAHFVDVIHTDDAPRLWFPVSVGINSSIGHIDFYPNGGKDQTGCSNSELRCHHVRANYLYTESIRQSCPFLAVSCSSYEEFLNGECWDCNKVACSRMGFKATLPPSSTGTNFFMLTQPDSPYCGSHYRVTIEMSNSSASLNHGGEFADIRIHLHGRREQSDEIKVSETSVFFRPANTHRRVVLAYDVGEIQSLDLNIRYDTSFINPMSWRLQSAVLFVASITVDQLSTTKTWTHTFMNQELAANVKHRVKMIRMR